MSDQPNTRLHYALAATSFIAAFLTYLLTMQPSIPFWDCGEFASAAWALQIPHPPGAPLWTLVGRIGMLIPLFADTVARYNFLSVLASAATVTLLYLTLVKIIRVWRGAVSGTMDAVIVYFGAFIGALSYTWTDSFWFNAVECEVYAFGSLFIALVLWLAMVWQEHADELHSERYLLLIAYVIGLSLGVHQLALLTLFPVFMIVYYRRRTHVTAVSWIVMALTAAAVFILIYVVLLTKLVGWAGHGKGWLSLSVLIALAAVLLYAYRTSRPTLTMLATSLFLVLLGYTTYTVVLVRASQNPPMNEGTPSNFARLASYINRDQYGDWKLLPRRLEDQKASHPETWSDYTSDAQFFWSYQTNFMFHRYLAWNFIGRQDDDMGAGVDPTKTLGLPLLLGLFGLYYHFRRDPHRALSLLAALIFLGYLTVWYQNQQEPQPRERDYFYVGAFYIYAMWIGIGAVGVMDWLSNRTGEAQRPVTIAAAIVGLIALVPINQCVGLMGLLHGESFERSSKWAEYSRRNNRVPFEYGYNILQSCEPDAILFTYGDNDTFPIWCLQDVYGIRRDIRIVQLQLASAMSYCQALTKPNDWGTKPIKLSVYSDSVMKLPEGDAYAEIQRLSLPVRLSVSAEQVRWMTGIDTATASGFMWAPQVHLPTDFLVADIIRNNMTSRPIYYSVTVPESERAGLNPYLVYEGLAARVTPVAHNVDPTGVGGEVSPKRFTEVIFNRPVSPVTQAERGLRLYSYSDPSANLSSMDKSYAMTYRLSFLRYADAMLAMNKMPVAAATLDTMEARIPVSRVPVDYPYASLIADLAEKSANWRVAKTYAEAGVRTMRSIMSQPDWRETDRFAAETDPELLFGDLLMRAGEFGQSREVFGRLYAQATGDRQALIGLKLKEVEAREARASGDFVRSDSMISEVLRAYDPDTSHRGEFLELWNLLKHGPSGSKLP